MEFKVGDKAFYPGYGLGRITAIETKEILGDKQKFYSILMLSSDARIMVPEYRMESVRSTISQSEAKKVLEVIHAPYTGKSIVKSGKNWSKKYQQYLAVIKTGNIFDIAKILQELLHIQKKKNLSFYEKQLMFTVCKMLFDELSLVVGKEKLQESFDFSSILATLQHN